ncbi:unnamed protein product [Effrenium voratum]|nr:unnamed protein product [Effrenium voratum]
MATHHCAAGKAAHLSKVISTAAAFAALFWSGRSFVAGRGSRALHSPRSTSTRCTKSLMLHATCEQMDWDGPDPAVTGQLRALGRLLRTAAEQLVHAAELPKPRSVSEPKLHSAYLPLELLLSGKALRAAAEALLAERWAEASACICNVPRGGGALFCKDDLQALQLVLAGSLRIPGTELQEALMSVGRKLESATDSVDETLHDFFLRAAAALRSAARLFKPNTPRPARSRSNQRALADIEEHLLEAPLKQRQAMLRSLVKQYHPDRNPGREMEVLPAFLHVQHLRDEMGRWS